ncbi:arginase family protein [Oleiagrimonas sp.]|jgi:arginase family enzyme|uniref:arginase family protein n=1 Tax=Oleiagrimonas sp. TaxID=2010330 RepID=UPI0026062A23|nr:arginase family protein [Oleiagrimonas sp.]MDA3914485.1 arginase family protein [Oleiagrimonas sp.]
MNALVLDLDGSATGLDCEQVLDLRKHEQALRFACSMRRLEDFARELEAELPPTYGTVLTGSGDFHHLSLPLIRAVAARRGPLEVVVLDNHPDNMRYPFGVHCGSWVRRVTELAGVRHVHVAGITSGDISLAHAWENQWRPLRTGRLTYWSTGVHTSWARRVGLGQAFRAFADMPALVQALGTHLAGSGLPVYLSIDKDVLSARDAHTNWDQGVMCTSQMLALIQAMHGRIVGSDITGDVSQVDYQQGWKRFLSALDRQPRIPEVELLRWQDEHRLLNQRLIHAIAEAMAPDAS